MTVTDRGREFLRLSAAAFDRALEARSGTVGRDRMDGLRDVLAQIGGGGARLDLAGWLGG